MPSHSTTTMTKSPPFFPAPFISLILPHLLRSVSAGFSQSLAWLGREAPSLPEAVGGKGRELILVALGSSAAPVDDRKTAARERTPRRSPLTSDFDERREKGAARDATRRESAGCASEVVGFGIGRRRNFFFLRDFDSMARESSRWGNGIFSPTKFALARSLDFD